MEAVTREELSGDGEDLLAAVLARRRHAVRVVSAADAARADAAAGFHPSEPGVPSMP